MSINTGTSQGFDNFPSQLHIALCNVSRKLNWSDFQNQESEIPFLQKILLIVFMIYLLDPSLTRLKLILPFIKESNIYIGVYFFQQIIAFCNFALRISTFLCCVYATYRAYF